jgi:hypothetical protein
MLFTDRDNKSNVVRPLLFDGEIRWRGLCGGWAGGRGWRETTRDMIAWRRELFTPSTPQRVHPRRQIHPHRWRRECSRT